MFFKYIFTVLFIFFSFPALAEDDSNLLNPRLDYSKSLFFVGVMEKATLRPRNNEEETKKCTEVTGEECIIVSSSCGIKILEFSVSANFQGAKRGEKLTAKALLSEWCNFHLTIEQQVVFVFKYGDDYQFYTHDFSIRTHSVYENEFMQQYFFLASPLEFAECQEITGVNCFDLLKPVEPKFIGSTSRDLVWVKEFEERGILEKNEENDMYMTHAIFISDLLKAIRLKEAGLRK